MILPLALFPRLSLNNFSIKLKATTRSDLSSVLLNFMSEVRNAGNSIQG